MQNGTDGQRDDRWVTGADRQLLLLLLLRLRLWLQLRLLLQLLLLPLLLAPRHRRFLRK